MLAWSCRGERLYDQASNGGHRHEAWSTCPLAGLLEWSCFFHSCFLALYSPSRARRTRIVCVSLCLFEYVDPSRLTELRAQLLHYMRRGCSEAVGGTVRALETCYAHSRMLLFHRALFSFTEESW